MDYKKILKKTWHFIWEEDSLASWMVNIVLAFVLIKFIVYPVLGLVLGTGFPIVAVVSSSMEHNVNFDDWWESNNGFYLNMNIQKEDFREYSYKNGFNKGDIMILVKADPVKLKVGDVVVFIDGAPDPFIHRIVKKWDDNGYHFQTKGDNNRGSIQEAWLDETDIRENQLIGKTLFRVPFLGYIKIGFVEALKFLHIIK